MSLRRLASLAAAPRPAVQPQVEVPVPLTSPQIVEQAQQEHEQVQKELREIDILVNQSTSEVEKLAQRNAQLTNRLRQMEANIDTYPRQDIKEVYTASQEAQMRLFMMRGQVEQLQSRQETLRRFAQGLQKVLSVISQAGLGGGGSKQEGPVIDRAQSVGIIKIIDAQENERQHLANQLHDGPAQSLTNLILQAEICERLFDRDPVRARSELSELKGAVTTTFQKVREFIFDLRPMMLDDLGLNPTLKKSIADYERKTSVACNLSITGIDHRLPPHTEVTIFRVIQHLLNNVKSHAQATHVQVTLNVDSDKAAVMVEDDGSGFDVKEVFHAVRQRKTIGLASMKEQVEMLGGGIEFVSSPGRGARIEFWLPVEA